MNKAKRKLIAASLRTVIMADKRRGTVTALLRRSRSVDVVVGARCNESEAHLNVGTVDSHTEFPAKMR